jgi:hypothetical protein
MARQAIHACRASLLIIGNSLGRLLLLESDPLGASLTQERLLRTSPLVAGACNLLMEALGSSSCVQQTTEHCPSRASRCRAHGRSLRWRSLHRVRFL